MHWSLKKLQRVKKCPKYIYLFENQRQKEALYVHNLPALQSEWVEPVETFTNTRIKYNRLVNSKKFKRNANFRWLESYEWFLQDMGEAPEYRSKLVLIKGMTSYNNVTCKWS